ncbi:glycosyltransferase family 49 protein [Rhodotorula toruloides]|uniref:Glycosyltransferase family 49 protein n=1 Tax=Rhodotorula toruloides TaxID=5286 RepID=A0A511KE61_RHOTO|nr:glycosyltransferase family 49 protein [Rhodotorula toruloides]
MATPPAAGPSTDSSRGLRSRKLSLTTRQLPVGISSGSQLSPSTTTSSPTIPQPADVGLGLMLDEANGTASARTSIDAGASAIRSRANSFATAEAQATELEDFFLSAAAAGTSTLGGSGGGGESSSLRRTPSGRRIPMATVTSPTGTTSSPLTIFTGSPVLPNSPVASPVPYSPAHQSYNLGNPVATTSQQPTSIPMSRPPSYNTAMGGSHSHEMQRTRSNGSDIHSRQQSLTSACAPVTSSVFNTPKSDVGAFSPQVGAGPRSATWRPYDWGGGASEKGYSSDEDVREGGKRRAHEEEGLVAKTLGLPGAVLSIVLRPLSGGAPPRHPHSPPMNGSTTKPSVAAQQRSPLLIRLVLFTYLVFSTIYLSLSLAQSLVSPSSASSPSSSSFASLSAKLGARAGAGQEGWQLVREYADGLGAKAGLDLGWSRVKSGNEGGVIVPVEASAEPVEDWGIVRRIGHPDAADSALRTQDPAENPLSPFSHTYRFSKMHEKVHWDLHDEIVPFAFHAASKPDPSGVTACMYTNAAWLQTLPAFVRAWQGPVSLVFEATHSRLDSDARSRLLAVIAKLRDEDPLTKDLVDFHIVGAPLTLSERSLAKTRERMIKNPTARNYQLNLARFFAQTDTVFLVGDARVTPSGGLRDKLTMPRAREILLERGDAIVVPTFGFIRDPTGQPNQLPDFAQLRAQLGIGSEGEAALDDFSGVTADELDPLANEHIHTLFETLPLAPEEWPTRKQSLVQLVNTRVPSVASPTTARLALFDKRWDLNHGPSNWYLWRKSPTDPRLQEKPSSGGGLGLGIDGSVGGGREPYRVVDYDLHYSPLVAISKKGQPWCTERFDDLRAACTYQMYLSGAEMWVLPDEWAYTVEVVERKPEGEKEDPAEKLKTSISSRLYGKFHQEACMHYGREFLSVGMWDSDKAQHLRETCARTLGTWGMGSG